MKGFGGENKLGGPGGADWAGLGEDLQKGTSERFRLSDLTTIKLFL